ncbi:MAG: AAA family ATPase [Polyangiales bacterium]
MNLPYITIPQYATTGQVHAFADREVEVAQLYRSVVSAGNRVRAGAPTVRERFVVSGYMGVGKSAVVLETLARIRGERDVPASFEEPNDRQRWLVFYLSGKHYQGTGALADGVQRMIVEALSDIQELASNASKTALKIPLISRIFRSQEAAAFRDVKDALEILGTTILFVRSFLGGAAKVQYQSRDLQEFRRTLNQQLKGELASKGIDVEGVSAKAALEVASQYSLQWASSAQIALSVEHEITLSADFLVDIFNTFFDATARAKIPTILVMDDFDELASAIGTAYSERARVLNSLLGAFSRLAPSTLIVGLREEYTDVDTRRQYQSLHVPPMRRSDASAALRAWALLQQPALSKQDVEDFIAFGERFVEQFEQDAPVVVPFRYLQLVATVSNRGVDPNATTAALVRRYVESECNREAFRAFERLCNALTDDDVLRAAEVLPVDLDEYKLSDRERRSLESYGLVRPAAAGDATDKSVFLDPLFAYERFGRKSS